METRRLDLKQMKKRVEELEVLEGRLDAGQDVEELKAKMRTTAIRLKLSAEEYQKGLEDPS